MNYIPKIINKTTISFAVSLKSCYKCQKGMVAKPASQYFKTNTFPNYTENDFEHQAKRANLVFQSNIKIDDKYVCEDCKNLGNIDFLCCLCGERKPFPEHQSFGDPPEFLCTDCYNKVPVKEWDDKIEKLENEHRYDFE